MWTKATQKLIRSLDTRKGRRKERLFVAEGPKLVGELLGHYACVHIIATDEWRAAGGAVPAGVACDWVTADELQRVSLQVTPQQVLAIFRIPDDSAPQAATLGQQLTIALDNVQDPGNLGTIVRLADWFGVQDIWCSVGTADIWSPKAVQATMGGLARVRVHYVDLVPLLQSLPPEVPVYGTSLQGDSLWQASLQAHGVIVMGNEGNGVSAAVYALCRQRLLIPSYPPERTTTESLNVAMATGIVLAEFRRQQSSL